jgi:hypothetical protein
MSMHVAESETSRSLPIARIAVAVGISLLIVVVTIPNLGSVPLPDHKIGYGWRDALSICGILLPLVVILVGAAYSRVAECIGWTLLLILLVLRVTH